MKHKAYAKVNIFLKITAARGSYHEFVSRFMRVENLYDGLYFVPKKTKGFELVGDFDCDVKDNTIYKAYTQLLKETSSKKLEELLQNNALHVEKNIPSFAGLGGGSSDAATFLHMCNEKASLELSVDELAQIGVKVGADVPFFIYNYKSANVFGIGEIVEEFKEEPLKIETFTPKIEISTPKVFKEYREHFFNPISKEHADEFAQKSSLEILRTLDITQANDLYAPALKLYPKLALHVKPSWFFSGSGSSFFYIKD